VPKIGVRLPRLIGSAGEYLADVSALESAGVDTIWLESGGPDAWVILGALAAATQRVRLGCILAPGAFHGAAQVNAGISSAQKLSRDRIVLAVPASDVTSARTTGARTFSLGSTQDITVDGVIHKLTAPGDLPGPDQTHVNQTHIEVWGDIVMPADREAWTATMSAYETAGLTGVIVPWDARLVDLLRNAEPDDRSDLSMSTG